MACPTCYEMLLYLDRHKCHPKIMEKVNKHLDRVILEEISTFEEDTEVFWHSKDVRFWEYLLKREKEQD